MIPFRGLTQKTVKVSNHDARKNQQLTNKKPVFTVVKYVAASHWSIVTFPRRHSSTLPLLSLSYNFVMIQLFLGAKFPLNSSGPLHILNKITMLIIVKREMLMNKVFSLSLLRIYCIKKLVFPLFKKNYYTRMTTFLKAES